MNVLFVFLDGVGLGEPNKEVNPFAAARTPFFIEWLGGKLTGRLEGVQERHLVVTQADATLGVEGLPQSATGQTALLTGRNGATIMGRHYGPWPGPTLKRVLDEGSLFSEVVNAGKRAALANVYPRGYFWALGHGKQKLNVPVYAARAAGVRLRTEADYLEDRAVSADLTGEYLHAQNGSPLRTPEEAGANLAALASEHDFTFLDFWATDRAGHRWSFAESVKLVEQLDAFFRGLVSALERRKEEEVMLLVTSDHGNLEDKTTKSHTVNPVPLIAFGPSAHLFRDVKSLLDVAPAVRRTPLLTTLPAASVE